MAENDITTEVNADEKLVNELERENTAKLVGGHKDKAPLPELTGNLNPTLVEMTKRGVFSQLFSGVERCIRVLNAGSNNPKHCLAMMVSDSIHGKHCSSCQKTPNPGICNPTIINSSMIRLNDRELKEVGLEKDPSYIAPKDRKIVVPEATKKRAIKQAQEATSAPRRTKVKTPNKVSIEISMEELKKNPNVLAVMLQKTLDAIYELPVSNFREAEEIRVVKEKVELFLSHQGE